ncbi:MAG: MATE family efflux transporter [Deltaproteobacteria bacterium]|jgi:MATE family multidrug resistance protein|nr:MATE family efflux transporter [Deltaproteobacteria bacterium]MBW2531321.1 MATE family efflux transporter [Deltaproteobacteria bacterium]
MRREIGHLLRLGAPIAAAHVGVVLLGAVDTAVVGRVGETELGAVGLGNAVYFAFAMFGMGTVLGVDPVITQALGAGRRAKAQSAMWQGVWLAALLCLPLAVAAWLTTLLLEPFGIEPETARQASAYVAARLGGLPALMIFTVLRSFLQAHTITRPMLVGSVVANVLNLPLDWLLVFGDDGLVALGLPAAGIPALGVVGAGLTSTVVTYAQLLIVVAAVRRAGRQPGASRALSQALFRKSVRLGWPIGLQRLAEMGIFSLTGVLMGSIGTVPVAAHQVTMTIVSTTFMVPLGISAAAAVRVGRAVGATDRAGARRAGLASVVLSTAFMATCAVLLLLVPELLAAVLTDQPRVIDAAVSLLMVGALFQISDGLQCVASGSLRGMGDTRWMLAIHVAGLYLFGLPLGIVLAFVADLGAVGLWWGLLVGLTAVAATLLARFLRLSSRPVIPV